MRSLAPMTCGFDTVVPKFPQFADSKIFRENPETEEPFARAEVTFLFMYVYSGVVICFRAGNTNDLSDINLSNLK